MTGFVRPYAEGGGHLGQLFALVRLSKPLSVWVQVLYLVQCFLRPLRYTFCPECSIIMHAKSAKSSETELSNQDPNPVDVVLPPNDPW